jgi:NADPH:quinone reductase-like Zn-dependent oxidoreductase
MQVVRVVTPGSFDGLVLQDEPAPILGRRDVLVRVHAAALNFRDVVLAYGRYPGVLRKTPIPLSDGAGEVLAVGLNVIRVSVGDRVTATCNTDWIGGTFLPEYHHHSIGFSVDGMLSDCALIHENALVKIPDYLSYEEAACLPCAAVSAWSALTIGEPLYPGLTVLIQGTGGVALFGLQIAKMFGARVLAITSSADKAKRLEDLGADAVVNYNTYPNWDEEMLKLTNGRGVDKVIEIGGESTIQRSVACVRYGGEIGQVGFVTGVGGGLPPIEILKKSIIIKGISMGPRLTFEALLTAMQASKMHPVIDSVFGFGEYKSAFRRLESAKHVGKVVINRAGL